MTHDLKVWPEFFSALADGSKTFELRKNDRGFQCGDVLRLREYAPGPDEYTGRETLAEVTYVLAGTRAEVFGLRHGYCVLGLRATGPGEKP